MSTGSEDIAPDAQRVAEEHFARLVAGVQDYAIFLLSPMGHVKSWNAGAARILGYAADGIIGKHFSVFYPKEAIGSGWPPHELEVAAQTGRFEDEGWRLRKDESRFWSNVVITSLFDAQGQLSGFLKITRDLTERKQNEETLRQSEQRFRLLVEQVKDYAIFMLDPTGRVISWNVGAQRIKGYSAHEIIGKHFSVFYSSEDVKAGKPAQELEIAQAAGSVDDEGWRVRNDRSLFWANVVITAIYDAQNRLLGFAKVTRDMTEKRKVEQLEVADRQKNEFLAMLAHELRNPLAPISNGLQVLKLQNSDPTAVRLTAEMMERQVFHLVDLVDDLLDVSRVITGKMSFHRQPIELATVISLAAEESQSAIDARGHELMLSVPARPIVVDGDLHRLSQVITNLLQNAAKYTDQPSQIWLTVTRQVDQAIIRVKDSGIGISPDMVPHIFNLFVQADNSLARPRGGLGIGLNVVKRIIQLHDGTVEAKSAGLGQGSEFIVRLPISKSAAVSSQANEPTPADPAAIKRRKILVIDDNVDAAVTTASLLQAWGHDVQAAFSGEAALEVARVFQPEIALLDIGMPGMTGYDVARALRADPAAQGIIIVALTGYGQESDRNRSWDAGFDYHLTKPPDPSQLESLLSSPRLRSDRAKSDPSDIGATAG